MNREKQIQMEEKAINRLNVQIDFLECERDKEAEFKKALNPYLIKELSYIEGTLRCVKAEIRRIEKASINSEMVMLKDETGEIKLFNFATCELKKIPIMSMDDFKQYINRRAGFKVY